MRARIPSVALRVVVVAMVLAGCGRDPIYCRQDIDCLDGRVCEQRRCVELRSPDVAGAPGQDPPSPCREACRRHTAACLRDPRAYVPTIENCHRAGTARCDREMEACRGPVTDAETYAAREKPCTGLRYECNDRSLQKCFEDVCRNLETNCAANCTDR